jgi:hypothetical protein
MRKISFTDESVAAKRMTAIAAATTPDVRHCDENKLNVEETKNPTLKILFYRAEAGSLVV